ncbi:hypothetical protein HWV62_12845 [Athelia sp. TMB]|nr:hypothetical protein HWV62_12845 [Athelia sp. TMB]
MPRFNEDRHRRALLLSKRLNDIAAERRNLVLQLEDLNQQAKTAQREFNMLHNMDALTSNLPDEALAMIFEAGALPESSHLRHFGIAVSHVSSRWRRVALATSHLWTRIVWRAQALWPPQEKILRARTIAFLERSRLAPLDINIFQFRLIDFTPDFLQLLNDHIGRCRNLRIEDAQQEGLIKAIESLSNAAPLLSSIDFSSESIEPDIYVELPLLFPSGAPLLKSAQLHGIGVTSMHFTLPALGSITSLRLTGLLVDSSIEGGYHAFRNALMALQSLHHLELELDRYEDDDDTEDLPIVLPTIQYLRLDAPPGHLDMLTCCFTAENLLVLSLEGWDGQEYDLDMEDQSIHFPSLEHLILTEININRPFLDAYAERFPDITQLTCQVQPDARGCDIDYILTPICFGTQKYDHPEGVDGIPDFDEDLDRWPNLEVIAVSATDTPLGPMLNNMISIAKLGRPLRKLMLPDALCAQAGADAMAQPKELVQVEDYSFDWPMPFPE